MERRRRKGFTGKRGRPAQLVAPGRPSLPNPVPPPLPPSHVMPRVAITGNAPSEEAHCSKKIDPRSMCLRDNHGNFIKDETCTASGIPSPSEAEVWALHSAIVWIKGLGFSNVIIETDCKVSSDCFYSGIKVSSDFHVILNKYKDVLSLIPNFKG
ncbi:hypothetical protein HKD37_04G010036 [Glycine soja]